MADNTTLKSKMYVTSNFVNDAQLACNTLYLFGAAFKCPYKVSTTQEARECILEYSDGWINRSQYVAEDMPVSMRLSQCDYNTLDEWKGGYGVPTCIDAARRHAIVKIPYLTGLDRQWIGYLTYICNNIDMMYCTSYNDCVAFYFVIDDYINPSRRGTSSNDTSGKNDVTYLCFDLSAMNLSATLTPVYTCPTRGASWGGYVCSHFHNLAHYSILGNGCVDFDSYNSNCNIVDIGSVADTNQCVSSTQTSLISSLCNGDNGRLLITADGRYVTSTAETCYASDYLTKCSCACISTANSCIYIRDSYTCCEGQCTYTCQNTSAAQLHLNTLNNINFNDIIYFED